MRIFSITTQGKHNRMVFRTLRSRAFSPIAVLLSVLLLASTPVHAGSVAIGDVMQIIGSYQNPPELRLRSSSQTSSRPVARSNESTDGAATVASTIVGSPRNVDSLLSGVVVDSNNPQDPLIVVAQGDIDGTICDCGVVTAAGEFPKWPLLFLAAIPLFFINDDDCVTCDDTVIPTPTPTPNATPTPQTPIPEPASLLLFGSGLAAFGLRLRKRRMQAKLNAQVETEEG